jgi:hypothetical protein
MVLKVMIILIFFESMFASGGRARTASYKGQDFNAELHLELRST